MKVRHVLLDHAQASGVNFFCTALNRVLRAEGVDSALAIESGTPEPGAITRRLDVERPDIVHVHGIWLRGQHEAAVWARRNGIPVVWSTHGMTAPWALRHKRWKKLPAWWLYQRRDLRGAALLHATTETEAGWNRDAGLEMPQVVIPLGTAETGRGKVREARGSGFRVLFVGRVHPVKGLVNLMEAIGSLKARADFGGMSFTVVGPDEGGHLAEVQAVCARLGIADKVIFTGAKFGSDLSDAYEACDVLVLPSFTENFGGVVADALAHGKPVIASRFTPWQELETEGCGWWVENSPESLAEALVRAVRTPLATRTEMGLRGRRLVASRYSWSAVAQRMLEAYRKVLKQA